MRDKITQKGLQSKTMHYPGYISPEGYYFACPYGCHSELADWLCEIFGLWKWNISDNQRLLDELGWLKIDHEGNVLAEDYITQKQLDKLAEFLICKHHNKPPKEILEWGIGDVYLIGSNELWKMNIQEAIEYFEVKT